MIESGESQSKMILLRWMYFRLWHVEPKFTWDYSSLRARKLVLDNYTEVVETVENTDAVAIDN